MTDPPPPGIVAAALEAMRYNPLIVGVLVLNMLFVGVSAWYVTHTENARHESIKLILERCLPGK